MKEEKEDYAILVSLCQVDEDEYQQITKQIQNLLKTSSGLMASKTHYINDVDCISSYWVKYQVPDLSVHELNFISASSIIEN